MFHLTDDACIAKSQITKIPNSDENYKRKIPKQRQNQEHEHIKQRDNSSHIPEFVPTFSYVENDYMIQKKEDEEGLINFGFIACYM